MAKDYGFGQPIRSENYADTGEWARSSGRWSYSITENEFERALFITGHTDPPDRVYLMAKTLQGLVSHRISEGWKLISCDATSATLTRS